MAVIYVCDDCKRKEIATQWSRDRGWHLPDGWKAHGVRHSCSSGCYQAHKDRALPMMTPDEHRDMIAAQNRKENQRPTLGVVKGKK